MSELETLPYALVPFMALIIDAVIGDPRSDWHPVVLIGKLISTWENKLYPKHHTDNMKLFLYGCGVVLLVLVSVGIVSTVILYIAAKAGIFCYFLLSAVLLYVSITPRALARDGMEIYNLLKKGNVETARARLSWIVGRDTDGLNESEISRGTIETVAENTSDGVIAPLFYMVIGGALLGFGYKAVNTMDSMVGYKNEKYQYFGSEAAKFDDVVNYIPARLSAWLMILASAITHMDWKNAKKIFLRDRYNHKSPNSAQTESVMAGALDVQLAGDAWYFGKLCKKPTIGDAIREIEPEDIRRSHTLLYMTAVLALVVFEVVKVLVCLWYFTVQV